MAAPRGAQALAALVPDKGIDTVLFAASVLSADVAAGLSAPMVDRLKLTPKALKKGDIVNLDITVIKDGYHGDTSRMFIVGGDASILAPGLEDLRARQEALTERGAGPERVVAVKLPQAEAAAGPEQRRAVLQFVRGERLADVVAACRAKPCHAAELLPVLFKRKLDLHIEAVRDVERREDALPPVILRPVERARVHRGRRALEDAADADGLPGREFFIRRVEGDDRFAAGVAHLRHRPGGAPARRVLTHFLKSPP